jgi:hypothetical protein
VTFPHEAFRPTNTLPGVDEDEQPPICPVCGVTMVPAELSARDDVAGDWVCLECEENGEDA